MKKIAFALASLSLAVGGPAVAADLFKDNPAFSPPPPSSLPLAAIIEFYGGYAAYSDNVGNASGLPDGNPLIGGAARVSVPWSTIFTSQFDFDGMAEFGGDDDSEFSSSALLTGHASWRNSNGLLGFFGGGGLSAANDGDDPFNTWYIGAEGQLYLGNWTLYGQGGWLDSVETDGDNSDSFHDAWFVRGVARYFLSPNTLLQAEISYADGEQDTGTPFPMDILGWGVRLEHGLSTMPVAFFAAYEGARYQNDSGVFGDDGRFTEHLVLAGFKYRFGTGTLLENDRVGATLDTPRIGRWVAGGAAVD